jgi:HEAT repeat protein
MLISLVLLAGCGGGGDNLARKDMRPAKYPPKVPAKKDVPFEPRLAEQAKIEVDRAMRSDNAFVRAHAVEAIQDTLADEKSADIWQAMKDPDTVVRFAALMAAGTLKLADSKPELMQLADDPQPTVRIAAAYALHRMGDYRYSKDLERYSQDPLPEVRGNTALVLGMLGEPSAVNVLRPMLRDENMAVSLQAAEAMWRLGNEEGRDRLIGMTLNINPGYQMVAMSALGAPRDVRVRAHIRSNLTSDYIEVALVAARVMGQLGSDEGYGVAINGAKSSDKRQRALAALAFGAIGRLDAQEYLQKLLKDPDQDVRISAATAVLQLKAAEH